MIKPKDILYIDATPILADKLSGIGHVVLHTIRGLMNNNSRYEVKLLVPINKTSYIHKWKLDGVGVVRIPLPARVWNYLPRIRFMFPIDVFLKKGTYIFMNYKAWPLLKSKSITYVHDISFKLFPEFIEERNLMSLNEGVQRWIRKSTVVVTDSESSKNEILEYYPVNNDKVTVIYCGVDENEFKKASGQSVEGVKNIYGIKGDYFMFLSSLEPRKNIERLLGSLKLLPSEFKNKYSLLLVGGMGWQNEQIYKKIDELREDGWSIIKPEKYVPDEDVPILLSGASVLLHPALHEGFGMPAVEAMACETPVITSNIPVMLEVCGDAALYVDPLDQNSIASAVVKLNSDDILKRQLINSGIERAKLFTWERATNELIEAVESANKGIIN